jgi:CRP/FNR family cyclic AMP-dependent transcriptional regulator
MGTIDMRAFARSAGINLNFGPGDVVFREHDRGDCLYILQSGSVEMVIHDRVVDVCAAGEAFGFMSVIDGKARTSTARVRDAAEVSVIDVKRFRFMMDEVPNFSQYILEAMAHRIRGMGEVLGRE